ncbi:hypothetical protein Ahy_B01g056868 [Arachis hypogaea]|uniref:Replication factor A C-terminal domain-containing protein n=1 Tax=Arachis hypogaea TaxID=3818 RepID=A0A445AZQ5_ARAHY|nr:hypothetical protein Ahy_B01g056868 [Arachis hypogaea]
MYVMFNFIVVDKKENIRTTTNRWTINFSQRTTVILPIPELLAAEKLDGSLLIDVIGEVIGKENPRELIARKCKETKRLAVLIEDLDISCVLFGDMVDKILPYFEKERVEPLIVIAQCFKPSRWNEKTSVESHFNYSKLRINVDLEEVKVFRDRRLSGKPANLAIISQPASGVGELRRGDAIVKTIEEVLNSTQASTICTRKTSIGNRYECEKCGHTHGAALVRYKVEVMACDGTGSIALLMWDRKTELISINSLGFGWSWIPPTLETMMDRKLLFKVNVKSSNITQYDQIYKIIKICDDEEIVKMNYPKEIQNSDFAVVNENVCSNSIDVSAVVANMHNDTDFILTLNGLEEYVTSLKEETPAKRAPMGIKHTLTINVDNEDEVGFSTNKFSRKGAKRQKMQISGSDN